jgi:hypothetical protein
MMGKAKKKRSEVVSLLSYFTQGISDCSRCRKCLCVASDTVVYKCALGEHRQLSACDSWYGGIYCRRLIKKAAGEHTCVCGGLRRNFFSVGIDKLVDVMYN